MAGLRLMRSGRTSVERLAATDDGGAVGRPQGGGGVDHPNEVQQKRVQTDKRFCPPGVLTTRKSNIAYSIIGE